MNKPEIVNIIVKTLEAIPQSYEFPDLLTIIFDEGDINVYATAGGWEGNIEVEREIISLSEEVLKFRADRDALNKKKKELEQDIKELEKAKKLLLKQMSVTEVSPHTKEA